MIKVEPKNDVTVIVAAYKEDLEWTKNIRHKTIVYNKSDKDVPKSKNVEVISLPNLGRESQTYLHHIVENYDNLSEITIFCQGHPFDHSNNFIQIANCNSIGRMNELSRKSDNREWPENNEDFCGIVHYFIFDYEHYMKQDWDLQFKIPLCVIALEVMYPRCLPLRSLKSLWGANFAVSKRNIHRFSKAKYQKLIDYHGEFWSLPWAMESIWHHIFYEKDKPGHFN